MKKLKLIYNPYAGDKSFKNALDDCIGAFQAAGYETHVFRSMVNGDIDEHIAGMDTDYDAIVTAGGDGSVNQVVNAMQRYNRNVPLGIIPAGTANDFATHLKMPKDHAQAAAAIANGRCVQADLGLANDRYFINVCASGLFTNISSTVDVNVKDTLGKLAYYLKGIEQLPNFMPMPIRISRTLEVIEEEVYLFMVLNSAGTGGFTRLSPEASINDGLFEFFAVRARPLVDMAKLLVNILRREGRHIEDESVIYFRDNWVRIESLDHNPLLSETDVDGELGPDMPVTISFVRGAVTLLVPDDLSVALKY